MSDINPMCCGSHCRVPGGTVRLYPLGKPGTLSGNLILCASCWYHENCYRQQRAKETRNPEVWPTVDWTTAEIYEGAP